MLCAAKSTVANMKGKQYSSARLPPSARYTMYGTSRTGTAIAANRGAPTTRPMRYATHKLAAKNAHSTSQSAHVEGPSAPTAFNR